MTAPATTPDVLGEATATPGRAGRWLTALALTLIPLGLALALSAVILAVLGVDPAAFYRDIVTAGIGRTSGLYDTITRTAPILLIGCGVIVVFRANLWNLGMDGQYLLAAAFVAGLGPWLLTVVPVVAGWVVLAAVAMVVGAAWTLVPSLLKARFGINEIVTSLMMTFIGISVAQILVKGPFDGAATVPQTEVIPTEAMLAEIPGTSIHIGVILALLVCLGVYLTFARTSFGTRLDVMGANPRAAIHVGIDVPRLIVVAFLISGALIGLAAAVDIQGIHGYMRADWNPAYGLSVVPLVFLARMNALALIPFAALFSMVSIGGIYAARQARIPTDFVLLFMGVVLLCMVGTQYLAERRARGERLLPGRPAMASSHVSEVAEP
jgi:general nucleoside transport system permease protein